MRRPWKWNPNAKFKKIHKNIPLQNSQAPCVNKDYITKVFIDLRHGLWNTFLIHNSLQTLENIYTYAFIADTIIPYLYSNTWCRQQSIVKLRKIHTRIVTLPNRLSDIVCSTILLLGMLSSPSNKCNRHCSSCTDTLSSKELHTTIPHWLAHHTTILHELADFISNYL